MILKNCAKTAVMMSLHCQMDSTLLIVPIDEFEFCFCIQNQAWLLIVCAILIKKTTENLIRKPFDSVINTFRSYQEHECLLLY